RLRPSNRKLLDDAAAAVMAPFAARLVVELEPPVVEAVARFGDFGRTIECVAMARGELRIDAVVSCGRAPPAHLRLDHGEAASTPRDHRAADRREMTGGKTLRRGLARPCHSMSERRA